MKPDTASEAPPPRRLARLSVDLSAIRANWRTFARRAAPGEAAAVVKADAYGCGARRVALALAEEGVRTFFVATLGEGVAARQTLGDAHDIYVLNGPEAATAHLFGPARLFPVLNDLDQIALWNVAGAPTAAALHIDTGMNRLGLAVADVAAAKAALAHADIPLVMSHLACSSTPEHPLNAHQATLFAEAAAHFPGARKSLSATGGVFLGRPYLFDLVRPGIGLYGDNSLDAGGRQLAVAATLEAPIVQVRAVGAGESVGYGASFVAPAPLIAATIALGYADGYLRAASGRGYGVLAGVRCPVLGRVSMDLITLDVTAAGGAARAGAWVEMLGAAAPLRDLAAAAGTAPYEVLTALAGVGRVYRSRS
ncbi:MAG: alanine racemase [Hyphomonadaceae bacterium]|nr:alanine racemase [Hyphomonadaceae bacterium]